MSFRTEDKTSKSGATTRAITWEKRASRSTYTKAKGDRLIDLMFKKKLSVNQACQLPGTPGRRTVYRWFKQHRDFWKSYIHMCEVREMCLTDSLMHSTDPYSRASRRRFNKALHKVKNLRPKRIIVERGPWGRR